MALNHQSAVLGCIIKSNSLLLSLLSISIAHHVLLQSITLRRLLWQLAQTPALNLTGKSGQGLVYDRFLRLEALRQTVTSEEREAMYEAFLVWARPQVETARDLLDDDEIDVPLDQLQGFLVCSQDCISTINSRLSQLRRTKKRKRIVQQVEESNKRAKLAIEVDPCLLLDVVVGGQTFVLSSDMVINILSFLPHQFTEQCNIMDTRLVNKLFCFAYHQTSAPWKMPKKLLLTPLGLFNGDFSLGWSKRLFLYTLYRSTDTKENGMMLKRMSQFKTMALENSNPNS